jgi:hypothetical protein
VLSDLRNGDPLHGVHQEHAGDEVTCPMGQVAGERVDAALDGSTPGEASQVPS